ncbi:MAG: BRCT domain-containing protein [Pseudomonadota bacterium]
MSRDLNNFALSAIHTERIVQRQLDELVGICKGALLDGHIDQGEAEGIRAWLNANIHCLDTWPASVLYDRLRSMLADGRLDADEERDLLGLVLRIAQPERSDGTAVSALPTDDPAPTIIFENRNFCFTGVFDFGSRAECQAAVASRGGNNLTGVTRKLHYLVIGAVGSEFWKHSTFGTKIAKAVDYRQSGVPLAIVSEHHWVAHLK